MHEDSIERGVYFILRMIYLNMHAHYNTCRKCQKCYAGPPAVFKFVATKSIYISHVTVTISHNVFIGVAARIRIDPSIHAACFRGDVEAVEAMINLQGANTNLYLWILNSPIRLSQAVGSCPSLASAASKILFTKTEIL